MLLSAGEKRHAPSKLTRARRGPRACTGSSPHRDLTLDGQGASAATTCLVKVPGISRRPCGKKLAIGREGQSVATRAVEKVLNFSVMVSSKEGILSWQPSHYIENLARVYHERSFAGLGTRGFYRLFLRY